jgi:hypothetical protein
MLLSPAGADPLLKQFEEFGIMRNVVELEAYGMTVVPPEVLNWAPGFAERLKVRPGAGLRVPYLERVQGVLDGVHTEPLKLA